MSNEIDVHKADSGKILKEIIKPGDGELVPSVGTIKIHYTGSLSDGTKFDSSRDRYGAFEFNVGEGAVISGLEIGILSMRKGEQAILTIAPDYAYGEAGNPPTIPPNSVLRFDVEVLDWKYDDLSPKKDGSIIRTRRGEKGIGYAFPRFGSLVEVHLNGKFDDKSFEERDLIFKLGEEPKAKVIRGVEIALLKFKVGEKSTVKIHPKFAFDDPTLKNSGVPFGKTVEYTIKLERFEKSLHSWGMDEDEKIQISGMCKEKGNQYFKQTEYVRAIDMYRRVFKYLLDRDGDRIKAEDEDCKNLLLSANLNIALCSLKIEDYKGAQKAALKAIDIDQNSDKAHFRCGQALLGLLEYEKALRHFEICYRIDPNNSETKNVYFNLKKNVKTQYDEEKERYLNMFDKFAKMDVKDNKSKNSGNKK